MKTDHQTVLESLNHGLHRAFENDERVFLIGEDVLDPYGGAFKVSRGLSSAYPKRVWGTPISEAGIVGIAAGMAIRGLLPVVEIMFGDFLTLAADQLINHIAKFHWMYSGGKPDGEAIQVPLVIRTPMGGRRGYGPTHSQSLEKLFLGVPGLRILAPHNLMIGARLSPGDILYKAILDDPAPILFIENKLLYLLSVYSEEDLGDWQIQSYPLNLPFGATPLQKIGNKQLEYPSYQLTLRGAPEANLTIITYGYMADMARQAVMRLAYEHEIFCELIIPIQLAPLDMQPVVDSVKRTHRLISVEEGNLTLGWGAEILARVAESCGEQLKASQRVAASDLPVPASSSLEKVVLPGIDEIIKIALKIASIR